MRNRPRTTRYYSFCYTQSTPNCAPEAEPAVPPARIADRQTRCSPCSSFTVAEVEAAFAYFSAAGFAVSDAILDIRVKMFFAKDPDGYVFELIEFPSGIQGLGDLARLSAARGPERLLRSSVEPRRSPIDLRRPAGRARRALSIRLDLGPATSFT